MDIGNTDLTVYMQHTIAVLRACGVDVDPLLKTAGIVSAELIHTVEEIPAEKYVALLDSAIALNIPGFGLMDGDNISLLSQGLLGYAMYSSATLGKCIARHSRYQDLLRAVFKTHLYQDQSMSWQRVDDVARPNMINTDAKLRYQAESLFVLWAQQGPAMGLSKQWFSTVHFNYSEPEYGAMYRDYFGCEVLFDQPYLQFGFDPQLLQRPFSFANETAAELCEQRCAVQLQELIAGEGLKGKIVSYLAKNPGRNPSIEEVATQLNTGERTLRRRLLEEGVTYKELVKNFRLNLAREYLSNTNLPLAEVAYLVGYSGLANFHRAFAARYGSTPGQYRDMALLSRP